MSYYRNQGLSQVHPGQGLLDRRGSSDSGSSAAAGLTTPQIGAIGSRVLAARVLLPLLVLLAGVAIWRGLAGERPIALRAARPTLAHPGAKTRHGLSSLPLAAQGAVSAALGSERHAYSVIRAGNGYRAVNPAQRLRVRFGRAGVHMRSGKAQLGLRLGAAGYGASPATVAPTTPQARGNRVVYAHAGLSEWYANGPLGLEQGFTLTRALPGDDGRPLTLSLALSGNARATVSTNHRGLTLVAPGGSSLLYDNLLATDARGRTLHIWITLQGKRLLLHVDARGVRYPLSIDPVIQRGNTMIQQGSKLTGKEETGEGWFGFSVALSADGNTALVGGAGDNKFVGAAWVFTRSEGKWTQQDAKITAKEETGAGEFGTLVALSSDGNTALIGGPTDNKLAGAAWVFTRSEGKWTQQGAKITGKEETGEGEFSYGVALSSDGNTALIGGPSDNKKVGAAWVFTRSEGKWTQQGGKITGKEETGEGEFGWKMALSSDGNTALIGGFGDNKNTGAAWAFTRSEGKWTQQAKLTGKEETGEGYFGYSVALSSDGNTALIGGPGDSKLTGAAWAFTRSEGKWTQQAKLTGKEETGEGYFGYGVALSSDGNMALIGGAFDNSKVGAAWVFTRSEGKWTQQGAKITGKEETGKGEFGFRVALSSDGNTALIGGFEDNKGTGGAWTFVTSSKLTGKEETGEGWFGLRVALSSDGNTALIGGPNDNKKVGAAWVFTRSEGKWTQQGAKITGKEETEEAQFGTSVALSSDGNTALIGGAYDNKFTGAAWVFTRSEGKWTQQGAKITGKEETEEGDFGYSVALSSDGNTALVGGPTDNPKELGGVGEGAVWVFTRSAGKWTQQGAKLKGKEEKGQGVFGFSVALSSDGNTALIGGAFDSEDIGAAWVFTRSEGKWTAQGVKLTGKEEAGEGRFGTSVALSSDGNTALIGGPGNGAFVGAVWVFTRSEGKWTQGALLTGSEEVGEGFFGYSVTFSSEANTMLVGGPYDNKFAGAVWVFTLSEGKWTQRGGKLTGSEEVGEGEFGYGVALSSEGNTALIGGPFDNKLLGAIWAYAAS